MTIMDTFTEETTEVLFGTRTIFVPGRIVEIGYSVRKKSSFPLVEELVLKLLNAAGSASLSDIAEFLDLPPQDLSTAFQPLLSKGLMTQYGADFQLSEVGKMLFRRSDDDTPALTESESRVHTFTIDEECALPVIAPDFSEHKAMAKGALKWLIDDLRKAPSVSDELPSRVRRNFGEYFQHFMRNEGDLEKIKEEQLELHRTEYAKTKDSPVVQADVQGVMRSNGVVVNRVLPFDDFTARPESRMEMRSALIEAAKEPAYGKAADEIKFMRDLFGMGFLKGIAADQPMPWFKVMPMFFSGKREIVQSGEIMVIGELCVPRNLLLIDDLFSELISKNEFSPEAPLRIAWLRPAAESWGRSIAFLDGIRALRKMGEKLKKGSVVLELWENRMTSESEPEPQLRGYWPWFDQLRYFRSSSLPPKVEMLLIGDGGAGIAVTHAFTPPQACFPCPLGVAFPANDLVRKMVKEVVEPKLRSLPKPPSKAKKTPDKSTKKDSK